MTDDQRPETSDTPSPEERAAEMKRRRSKIFDPNLKFYDVEDLARLYDAPDHEWHRWRVSRQDGGKLVRV